jgi:hypoxanthine-guanine phosphoribosyltransferase
MFTLVDDILDSGSNTMNAVLDYLQVKKTIFISIVTLITRETSPTQKNHHTFYN